MLLLDRKREVRELCNVNLAEGPAPHVSLEAQGLCGGIHVKFLIRIWLWEKSRFNDKLMYTQRKKLFL